MTTLVFWGCYSLPLYVYELYLLGARLLTELVGRRVDQTGGGRSRWGHATMLATLVFAASPASAYLVGPAVPLEELARTADLVCKATVIGDRRVTDGWFEPISGFEVRETELRVVSIVKGVASNVIRFRHYARSAGGAAWYAPESYTFVTGRTYLVLAAQVAGDTYRQLAKSPTEMDRSVLLAADARPHHGTTLTEAAWAELLALLKTPVEDDVVGAMHQLDVMSGGPAWDKFGLRDFERSQVLAAIQPLLGSKSVAIATAAITVFGRDSPYFDDQDAPFWFVGIGNGHLPGLGARKLLARPLAAVGERELLKVATTNGMTPELRAMAIRSLGRSSHAIPAAMVAVWLRDPSILVRRAAVLASADLLDREPIVTASTDGSPDIRCTAALAVGFAQDPRLVPLLDSLLRDPADSVRAAAALSLVSFPLDEAAPVMKANLTSDFRPVFVNALAQGDTQPYLAALAEIIERQPQAPNWGGAFPAGDSWRILFDFVKSRPAAELAAGKLNRSLDALERMHWFSSGEPTELYALYLSRGLVSRAKQFRETTRKSGPFDMEIFFDRVDQNPAAYLQ